MQRLWQWVKKEPWALIAAVLLSIFLRVCLSGWGMDHGLYWLSWAGFPGLVVMIFFTGPHGDTNAIGDIVFVLVNAAVYLLYFRLWVDCLRYLRAWRRG